MVSCIELASTVGASETQSLWRILDWKAILASWSHKAGNKPVGPSNIPWPAGRKMQRRNLQEINKNKRETKSLLCHAHRQSCISYQVVLLSHGKCENLLQNRPHVSVDMKTWKGIQHTIQNILCNNKKGLYCRSMTSWVWRNAHFQKTKEWLN